MQTYRCTCGNRLFFENTQCIVCQAEVGWCESCHRITALEREADSSNPDSANLDGANPDGGHDYRCSNPECRATLRKCHNYSVENVCNRLFDPARRPAAEAPAAGGLAPSDSAPPQDAVQPEPPVAPPAIPVEHLCTACQLNDTIPDLTVAGNREKWARLEAAKRRLLYTLDRLALPYADAALPLSFDFKADVSQENGELAANDWQNAGPTEVVYTGHADGKITINLREADDAERERLRLTFHESHRTLIGHFHHEIGHYYWQLLVDGHSARERQFKNLFGDHNIPTYADAMAAYYQNGPREGWPGSFISAYASAHPWEDFAETFALYLDIIAVLDTASHLFKSLKVNFRGRSVAPLVERFQEIGILENEFNRTMGLIDLVPDVVAAPVIAKLQFIHDLLRNAGTKRKKKSKPAAAATSTAVPMLTQQGSPPYYDPPTFEPAILVDGLP